MAPRAGARAAASKATKSEAKKAQVNGVGTAKDSVKKTPVAPTVNGTAEKPTKKAPAAASARSKKSATPAPATEMKKTSKRKARDDDDEVEAELVLEAKKLKVATNKRKQSHGDETESEPVAEAKKVKAVKPKVAKPVKDVKALPKGPRRVRGNKTEINALRYTEPLKVFVFGEGGSGELGLGATKRAIDVTRPRINEMLTNMNVVKMAAGGMHAIALTKDNKILTWGVNDNGALGRDTSHVEAKMRDVDASEDSDSEDETGGLNAAEATPTAISAEHFPEDTVFVDVVAGDSCSFALTTEGAIYGWGTFRKNEGILGFGRGQHTAKTPVYIDGVTKVTQIACGTNHVLALDKERHVYAWGNGQQNQLGRRVTERTLIESLQPNRVGFHDTSVKRPSQRIAKIACGDYHGLAIAEDGHIWSWGANNYCETGHTNNAGEDNASILTPQVIQSLEGRNVQAVEGGSHHNIAITKDGEVLTWGRCDGSQTGIPADQLKAISDESKILKVNDKPKILLEPTAVPNLKDIVTGSCGPEHTIVIDKDGKAYSWGFSANYQTGLGTDDDVDIPTLINNTAVRETKLTWAGCGGQYSILASKKE